MSSDWSVFRRLTRPLQLLIASQFVFNVGFFLVVPFLAAYLENDLRLGGALIGVILGVRTFSQQGLFFLGGALADRFGITPVVVGGVVIRIAGFLTLALTRELGWVVVGVVLIGVAAALFSPASESGIAGLAGQLEERGGPRRTQTLSVQLVASQAGSAVGPALGGVVLFAPFQVTCAIAAGLFAVIGVVHLVGLPAGLRVGTSASPGRSLAQVFRNRRFLAFAALNSVMLLAYNQMYLALPVELTRSGQDGASIAGYFLLASVCVITGQALVTHLVDRWPARRVFGLGYAITAVAFLVIAAVAWFPAPDGLVGALPTVTFVVLLHLGSMIVGPRSRDTVAILGREQHLGAYLGVMASMGGLLVLVASGPLGALLEASRQPGPSAAGPWLVIAALPLLAAVAAGPLLSRIMPGSPATARPEGLLRSATAGRASSR
ncbi:MAG: MFS transporter [Propioniciclava sp.]